MQKTVLLEKETTMNRNFPSKSKTVIFAHLLMSAIMHHFMKT